jgi:hypothetical protein
MLVEMLCLIVWFMVKPIKGRACIFSPGLIINAYLFDICIVKSNTVTNPSGAKIPRVKRKDGENTTMDCSSKILTMFFKLLCPIYLFEYACVNT